jgi:hypothetical protein
MQVGGSGAVSETLRSEQEVVAGMGGEARMYLKRVLEIERSRLHVTNPDLMDELLEAVKQILP